MDIDEIKLTSGRSLIQSNAPESFKWCSGKSCQILTKEHVESFGLFESNSPNFNTYYPDVTAKDLEPSEDEFIFPIFRALSATTVRKHLPIDFSKPGVLQASMKKLVGISIMTDHEANTGNVIGAIKSVEWQPSYTIDGLKVPAGANTTLSIDGKSHPKIARGIMSDPPSYHSVSVTVMFAWEQSHPKMDRNEFMNKWGSFDEKGVLIRKVVTEIKLYSEISVVPLGADPYARLLKDGKVSNPQFIKDRESLSTTLTELGAMDETVNSFTDIAEFSNFNNNPKTEDMNFSELMLSLGLSKELTEDQFKEQYQTLVGGAATLAKLVAKKEDLNEEGLQELIDNQKSEADQAILTFATENGGQDKMAEAIAFNATALSEKRTKAINLYKLIKGDEFKEEIVTNIESMNGDLLDTTMDTYSQEYEAQVPLTCGKCGSDEVSRKASEKLDDIPAKLSLHDTLLAKKRQESVDRIHGKTAE